MIEGFPKRPETGSMKFGEDWTGCFIRGDNAGYLSFQLSLLRDHLKEKNVELDFLDEMALNEIINLLSNSLEGTDPSVQRLKEFDECI